MQTVQIIASRARAITRAMTLLGVGMAAGFLIGQGQAATTPPGEHKGLDVVALGVIPETSLTRQIGLSGYKLQLREIAIAPGGQIAKHSHEKRPGLVKVIRGTWREGRPDGERDFSAGEATAILEDEDTVHWFWNRTSETATALVCDIVPAS